MTGAAPHKPLSRNFVFATISAGSAVLLLLLNAVATQILGPTEYGKFAFALSMAMIGEALMDLGIHQVTIRSIARDRSVAARLFYNSLSLKALPGSGMLIAMGVATLFLTHEPDVRTATLLMLLSAVPRSYLLTVRGILLGLEDFAHDTVVVVGDRLLLIAIGGLTLWYGGGILGLGVAFVVSRTIALIGALFLARSHTDGLRLGFDTTLWWDLQRRALPLGAFMLVLILYSYIDSVMLKVMTTYAETGFYSAAYKIYEGLTYAPAILSSVLTPRLSKLWGSDRGSHRSLTWRGIGGAIALGLLLVGVMWPLSRFLIVLVSGSEFGVADTALKILLTGLVFVFVIWILHAVAISVFEERLLLRTTAVGLVANVGSNFYLIPHYGRNGAALATVIGELVVMLMLLYGLRRVLFGRQAETGK